MSIAKVAPYGAWKSPITSKLIVSETIGLGTPLLDGTDIYWLEGRPAEGGRNVIVRRSPDGTLTDMLPRPFNARTRVHEYGGGSFIVHEGTIYFSNYSDQRLYRLRPGEQPEPLTPETELRYADGVIDAAHRRMICVRENHRVSAHEAVNTIVGLSWTGNPKGGQVLASGHDFYATPRLSPDGRQLAWLTWEHPNMPWDATALWVARVLVDGRLDAPRLIAGGADESIYQPAWSPDGVLHFVSDRTGWWNLYRWREGRVEPLLEMAAEFGEPQWVFGMSTYAFCGTESIITTYAQDGSWHIAQLDSESSELQPLETPYTNLSSPQVGPLGVALRVGAPAQTSAIALFDQDLKTHQVLRSSSAVDMPAGYLSAPEPVEFPTTAGLTAHGLFYAPQNVAYTAPEEELPPLLVFIHGGPTAAASSTLNLKLQYWTSRGFAVLDVNYGGSTGYGRAYRERLNGQWGVVDVDDCVNGARYLVTRGLVDGERLAIRGGSAGGYTTLCALTFHKVFKAGASYYGIGDLEALAQDTHKFESRYLERLVGPYPARKDIYEERSPLHFTDQLSCPVIFFQGLEDQVVPPQQAEQMVAALESKGVPVAYLPFEGEQHGFRRAENIKRALDAELYFYSRIFDFPLAEPVKPVTIKNL
ncbi:MAG: S9 family peptidase [Chloroflexota bacterium]|nr:S9 family peptidase [Chloroflexota bacterium]